MKHRIDNLEIGEYDEGWEATYEYNGFKISMDLDEDEVHEAIKQHYYKVIDNKIENELYKNKRITL